MFGGELRELHRTLRAVGLRQLKIGSGVTCRARLVRVIGRGNLGQDLGFLRIRGIAAPLETAKIADAASRPDRKTIDIHSNSLDTWRRPHDRLFSVEDVIPSYSSESIEIMENSNV